MVDHLKQECVIKLIDMSFVDCYTDLKKRDKGFIFGLQSLKNTLENMLNKTLFRCGECTHINNLGVLECKKC